MKLMWLVDGGMDPVPMVNRRKIGCYFRAGGPDRHFSFGVMWRPLRRFGFGLMAVAWSKKIRIAIGEDGAIQTLRGFWKKPEYSVEPILEI